MIEGENDCDNIEDGSEEEASRADKENIEEDISK